MLEACVDNVLCLPLTCSQTAVVKVLPLKQTTVAQSSI